MAAQFSQRIERKYTFLSVHSMTILSLVDHCCMADPLYPGGIVSSIYYDTPALAAFNEKRNGDYVKCKVRLRWYTESPDAPAGEDVPCFLEVKRRFGSVVKKSRIEMSLPGDLLARDPLFEGRIAELPSHVSSLGLPLPGILVPILHVRYHRRRFLDMETRARISLDTDIQGMAANDAFIAADAPVQLDAGVLEIKGDRDVWPRSLLPLRGFLAVGSFSKYARCLESALAPLGRRV